jgi:hypothetical protein
MAVTMLKVLQDQNFQLSELLNKKLIPLKIALPWWRGAVDIIVASGTRRPGFESRQRIRFLGKHSIAVVYKMT